MDFSIYSGVNFLSPQRVTSTVAFRDFDEEVGDYSGPPQVQINFEYDTTIGVVRGHYIFDASVADFNGQRALDSARSLFNTGVLGAGAVDPLELLPLSAATLGNLTPMVET